MNTLHRIPSAVRAALVLIVSGVLLGLGTDLYLICKQFLLRLLS
jgi:hypothetical protein